MRRARPGFGAYQTLIYVVLPQAVRNVLPDLVSNTVEVVKLTSIASVVALPELLYSADMARSVTFNSSPDRAGGGDLPCSCCGRSCAWSAGSNAGSRREEREDWEPRASDRHVAAAQMGPIQKADSRQAVVARMLDLMEQAKAQRCDFVVYPELALTTFFPRWYMTDRRPRSTPGSSARCRTPRRGRCSSEAAKHGIGM